MTSTEANGDVVRILADIDGPVHQAIREGSSDCALAEMPSFGDHYVYKVSESKNGKLTGSGGGVIGGDVDGPPRVLAHFDDTIDRAFVAGAPGYLAINDMVIHAWVDGSVIGHTASADDVGLATSEHAFVGDALFWNSGNSDLSRQRVWTQGAGTVALLSAGDDPTHGYGDLATDGTDVIWNEGTRVDASQLYPVLSIVTSPYSTTTAGLVPRVLRADLLLGNGFGVAPWVVGCGYAARYAAVQTAPGDISMTTHVIRLSDGTIWMLPAKQTNGMGWISPLAITCDELVALVSEGDDFSVARLRLDALGPGIPPP